MKISKFVKLLVSISLFLSNAVYAQLTGYKVGDHWVTTVTNDSLLFDGKGRDWWYKIAPSKTTVNLINSLPNSQEQEVIDRVEKLWPESKIRAIMLLDGNKVLYSNFRAPATSNSMLMGYSMGKTITAMAAGKAICSGKLTLTSRAKDFIPELQDKDLGEATLEQLLKMSAGTFEGYKDTGIFNANEFAQWNTGNLNIVNTFSSNAYSSYRRGFFTNVKHGEEFMYKSTDPFVVGAMVAKATNKQFAEFLQEAIFNPAGIKYPGVYGTDRFGNPLSDSGTRLRMEDWARFAYWVKQSSKESGCFGDYVRQAMTTRIKNANKISGKSFAGYGYFTWTENTLVHDSAWALGHGGQRIGWDLKSDRMIIVFANEDIDALDIYSITRAWNKLK